MSRYNDKNLDNLHVGYHSPWTYPCPFAAGDPRGDAWRVGRWLAGSGLPKPDSCHQDRVPVTYVTILDEHAQPVELRCVCAGDFVQIVPASTGLRAAPRDAAGDELVYRIAPAWAWTIIDETLALDARSAAFDGELRARIAEAVAAVVDASAGGRS